MAKVSRRTIHVDAKDLKKSILNANKSLERKNNRLKDEIRDKEKSLKNLDKEVNSYNTEIKSLFKVIEDEKKALFKMLHL